MTKKRSLPHGRSSAKAKNERVRIFTPTAAPPEPEETSSASIGVSNTPAPIPGHVSGAPRSAIRGYTPRGRSTASGLITDYRYVVSDLHQIGLIAGAVFVILVVLAFVIH